MVMLQDLAAVLKVYGAKLIHIDKNRKAARAKNRQSRGEGRERRRQNLVTLFQTQAAQADFQRIHSISNTDGVRYAAKTGKGSLEGLHFGAQNVSPARAYAADGFKCRSLDQLPLAFEIVLKYHRDHLITTR